MIPFAKTLLNSMFKKESTVQFPFAPIQNDELVRGHITIDIKDCIYCGMCKRKCPTGAIDVVKQDKMWSIERFQCIQCNCCAEVCPKKCLHMHNGLTTASFDKTKDVVKDA